MNTITMEFARGFALEINFAADGGITSAYWIWADWVIGCPKVGLA